jgi:hypothetical protein
MNILYYAKEPDQGVMDDLERFKEHDITICACLPGYVDYYKLLGYNVIDYRVLFSGVDMSFDVVIGNPPYNGGLYCKFMSCIGDITSPTGSFDVLLPSYTFTRKKSRLVCINDVKLTHIDLTVGEHFAQSIDGAWVTRFIGTYGRTGDDPIELTFTDGNKTTITLNDIVPTSEKFIKPNGLLLDDLNIVRKVLTSTIECRSHKTGDIDQDTFVYIKPTLKYVGKPSPAAGSFTLHGVINNLTSEIKNGWYIVCDQPQQVYDIYTKSKLFNFVHWLMVSDFPMINRSYIESLPDVTNMTYKNEAELYEQFNLTESEIQRVESIFP